VPTIAQLPTGMVSSCQRKEEKQAEKRLEVQLLPSTITFAFNHNSASSTNKNISPN
jgi:hypothetical protein